MLIYLQYLVSLTHDWEFWQLPVRHESEIVTSLIIASLITVEKIFLVFLAIINVSSAVLGFPPSLLSLSYNFLENLK